MFLIDATTRRVRHGSGDCSISIMPANLEEDRKLCPSHYTILNRSYNKRLQRYHQEDGYWFLVPRICLDALGDLVVRLYRHFECRPSIRCHPALDERRNPRIFSRSQGNCIRLHWVPEWVCYGKKCIHELVYLRVKEELDRRWFILILDFVFPFDCLRWWQEGGKLYDAVKDVMDETNSKCFDWIPCLPQIETNYLAYF